MSCLVKICGLSSPEGVIAARDGGAAFVGFVFFDKSPRNIRPMLAQDLTNLLSRGKGPPAKSVAVCVDPDNDALAQMLTQFKPDLIQLHGKETPARCAEIRSVTGCGLIKAVSVSDASDIQAARVFDSVVDHLLFDARPPKDADLPGGVGARFDWTLLQGQRFSKPWFLAGGLDPWNVAEAVHISGAPLVDVSSGVERGPGLKDPALISAFLERVRSA
ncbi:MAG: phosphoribosylanthranilate isomerase [Asticcacaulis sp.]